MLKWQQRTICSLDGDLIRIEEKLIVPEGARKTFPLELHETNAGIKAAKALARTQLWWPGLDQDVEQILQQCTVCQQATAMPPSREPLAWPATAQPWATVHVDSAGFWLRCMLVHRSVPSGLRQKLPAQILQAFRPKVTMDLVVESEVKTQAIESQSEKKWIPKQPAFVKCFCKRQRWQEGVIVTLLKHYMVEVQVDKEVQRHHNQIRKRHQISQDI